MKYHINDSVIHWSFGPGRIIGIDEKTLANKTHTYYVVEAGRTTLWVPVDENGELSIRRPTPKGEFKELLELLKSPSEDLPDNHYQRQSELSERMHRRNLHDICFVIRDLVSRSQSRKLNRNDSEILERAEGFLLDEWEISLGTPRSQAVTDLNSLLVGHATVSQALGV